MSYRITIHNFEVNMFIYLLIGKKLLLYSGKFSKDVISGLILGVQESEIPEHLCIER